MRYDEIKLNIWQKRVNEDFDPEIVDESIKEDIIREKK